MYRISILLIASAFLFVGCGTTVETTMTKSWEKEVAFNSPEDLNKAQIHLVDDGKAITLITPAGVETIDSKGGTVYEVDRQKFFRTYVRTTRGAEELTDKITYIYLPHRHSLLEFNYSMTAESVTMIDLDDNEISWINDDLQWSLERYQEVVRAAAKGLNAVGAASADMASEIMLPERFVGNMTNVIPELDAMLFKTLDGLQLISLESGEVLWTNEEIKGGIVKMFYDSESSSIVVVNNNNDLFKLPGIQFNKQIARINADDGSTIWINEYDGNVRQKLDGIGTWADREVDVRLLDDTVMLNFLNVELYDFETGDKLWQTSEGANKLMDMVAPEAQIMNLFAFPVIHDGMLYRVGFENVGLTGVDVIIEAFDQQTGERLWKSDKLSKSKPVNNIEVVDDKLIVSMGSSEGVVALDAQSGKRIWSYEKFGRRGVEHYMYKTEDGVVAAGKDRFALISHETGDDIFSIDTDGDELGNIEDIVLLSSGIAVSGSDGFALYDAENGDQLYKIATPTGGLIQTGNDRILIKPKPNYADAAYPVDGAFYIVDDQAGELKSILGTDKNRRTWRIDEDFNRIYVLTGNKLEMYESE